MQATQGLGAPYDLKNNFESEGGSERPTLESKPGEELKQSEVKNDADDLSSPLEGVKKP